MLCLSDVTEMQAVPYGGFCVSIPTTYNVVIPKILNDSVDEPDCFCPITIAGEIYNTSSCGCINETILSNSPFYVYKIKESIRIYKLCFNNLTRDINNTVIHFYESLRYCVDRFGHPNDSLPYKQYQKSLKIVIGEFSNITVE